MVNRSVRVGGGVECGRGLRGGFSLIELLVVIAIIVIVIAGMVTVGAHVRTKAQVQTTQTTIQTLVSALRTYKIERAYPDTVYPGDLPVDEWTQGSHNSFIWDDAGDLTVDEQNERIAAMASVEALYYWLDQASECQEILGNLPETATANDDGDAVLVDGRTKALIEVNDAWGNPIRYGTPGNGNVPVLDSSGPDGVFDTADDIISTEFGG